MDGFEERDRLEKDMRFLLMNLPDEINLGVFLVDVKELKTAVKVEIKKKLDCIKALSI
jgi:hypothetical protein